MANALAAKLRSPGRWGALPREHRKDVAETRISSSTSKRRTLSLMRWRLRPHVFLGAGITTLAVPKGPRRVSIEPRQRYEQASQCREGADCNFPQTSVRLIRPLAAPLPGPAPLELCSRTRCPLSAADSAAESRTLSERRPAEYLAARLEGLSNLPQGTLLGHGHVTCPESCTGCGSCSL